MSFIAEQAGGKGSTGKERVLDIKPSEVHQRVPLFIGEYPCWRAPGGGGGVDTIGY
jgi:fructose-1,6-bisphosphatase